MPRTIAFNRPHLTGSELANIEDACAKGTLSGNGHYSLLCETWLETQTKAKRALLTHSCTGAMEMAAILLDLRAGDEVIMPAYTFVSTANAVVLRGAVPVFADVRADTLNIDASLIEALITPRTRSIWVVHYAGVACDMDAIMAIAKRHGLSVVEDAAQGVMATYKGQALGAIGDMGAFSFHETKNVTCGEGGALLLNRRDFIARAEIIHEKGTDRRQFSRGNIDKYTWQDVGSSFILGELAAAFLHAQLECAQELTDQRIAIWNMYHAKFEALETAGLLTRPYVPEACGHNAHMYYILLGKQFDRAKILSSLQNSGVHAVFHYVPLHTSPAGQRMSNGGSRHLPVTEDISARIIRLPLWVGMSAADVEYCAEALQALLLNMTIARA